MSMFIYIYICVCVYAYTHSLSGVKLYTYVTLKKRSFLSISGYLQRKFSDIFNLSYFMFKYRDPMSFKFTLFQYKMHIEHYRCGQGSYAGYWFHFHKKNPWVLNNNVCTMSQHELKLKRTPPFAHPTNELIQRYKKQVKFNEYAYDM